MADSDLNDLENIINKLPLVLPRGLIDVEAEQQWFRNEKDVYLLRKAPTDTVQDVTGTLNGSSGHSFVKGTDYDVIDDESDSENDSIDWSIGGDSPDDGTYFYVDYRADSVISRYVAAHDTDVDNIESDINAVIQAAQVENAPNEDLERVGAIFGSIGKRGGRNEDEYRRFLKSIVQAFKGRGTKPGMRNAIAAGIGADSDEITIIEDTDNTGYEIEIASTVDTDAIGEVVNDMAELADPSGVKLLSDPVFLFDGDTILVTSTEATVSSTSVGLGGGTLTLDGNSTFPSPSANTTASWDSGDNWDNSNWA